MSITNRKSILESMMERQLALQGRSFLNIPRDPDLGDPIVSIPGRDRTYIVDTARDNMYVMQNDYMQTDANPTAQVSTRSQPWWVQNSALIERDCESYTGKDSLGDVVMTNHNLGPVSRRGLFQSVFPRWGDGPVRDGLRLIPAAEYQQYQEPETPTKFTCDSHFNDLLYVSLKGDSLPPGINPLDDYLNRNEDARMRMYMEHAIGNQGCVCECESTDLDKYLKKHKHVHSAIALRSTLSDECRQNVREPVAAAQLRGIAETIRSIGGQLGLLSDASAKSVAQISPWEAPDEDEGVLIG